MEQGMATGGCLWHCAVAAALTLLPCAVAEAIFWNNDPSHGVTSTNGLTDRVDPWSVVELADLD